MQPIHERGPGQLKNNDQAPEAPDELPEGQLEELIEQLEEYPMGVPVGKSSEQPKKRTRNTRGKN